MFSFCVGQRLKRVLEPLYDAIPEIYRLRGGLNRSISLIQKTRVASAEGASESRLVFTLERFLSYTNVLQSVVLNLCWSYTRILSNCQFSCLRRVRCFYRRFTPSFHVKTGLYGRVSVRVSPKLFPSEIWLSRGWSFVATLFHKNTLSQHRTKNN